MPRRSKGFDPAAFVRTFSRVLTQLTTSDLTAAPVEDQWHLIGDNQDLLRQAIDRLVKRHSGYGKKARLIGDALLRQALHAGPHPELGYGERLSEILNAYASLNGPEEAIWFIVNMEWNGWHYASHTDSVLLLREFLATTANDSCIDNYEGKGREEKRYTFISGFLGLLAQTAGWNHNTQSGAPTPLSHPELPSTLCKVMYGLGLSSADCQFDLVSQKEGTAFTAMTSMDVWMYVLDMHKAGVPTHLIRKAFETMGAEMFWIATALKDAGAMGEDTIIMFLRDWRQLRRWKAEKVSSAVRQWSEDGRRCALSWFIEHGSPPKEERKPERVSDPFVLTSPPREEPPPQVTTGHKRHHPNYRAPQKEPVAIDWEKVASRLEVGAMAGLDETLVQAILVQGVLREGDRYAGLTREAKDKALVKAVRRSLDVKEREVARALGILVREHVLLYRGGSYRLATPTDAHPKARDLLRRLHAIGATLTT